MLHITAPILIAKPTDISLSNEKFVTQALKDKKFYLKVPSYAWELVKDFTLIPEEFFISTLIKQYYLDCTNDEKQQLVNKGNYLRFMLFQDCHNSNPYVYGYLRAINVAMPQHQHILNSCPNNMVPVEVNLSTYGLFIFVNKQDLINNIIGQHSITIVN